MDGFGCYNKCYIKMRRWMFLIMLVLVFPIVEGLEFCKDTPQINTDCIMLTPVISCDVYNYSIFNTSEGLVENGDLYSFADGVYYFNFTLGSGEYAIRLCDGGLREVEVIEGSGGMGLIAAIVLLPLFFGIFALVGAVTLNGEDHGALKVFLYLISFITVWVSFHFGLLTVIKYYDFPELQNLMGSTTYWMAIIFFAIVVYFLIYVFIKGVHVAAQNKKERLQY